MKPNFLILGAAKSGTTSLADYLAQHPDIFMPGLKEPNYFAFDGVAQVPKGPAPERVLEELLYNWSAVEEQEYTALFGGVTNQKAVGEASVRYLYFGAAADRIRNQVPAARLVAILREPVGRMFSHYNMNVQKQIEPLGFMEALEMEPDRIAQDWGWDWHYRSVSCYATQVKRYFDMFGKQAVAVYLYDDFVKDPLGVISGICRHIGVDPNFKPDMEKRGKVAYRPFSRGLDKALNWPGPIKDSLRRMGLGRWVRAFATRATKLNYVPAKTLDPSLKKALSRRFASEVRDLSDLLGREVPW